MSVSVWHAVRAAANHHVHHPVACRFVAGRRLPSFQQRTTHTSPSRRREGVRCLGNSPSADSKSSKIYLEKLDTTANQAPQVTNDPAADSEHQRSVGGPPADDGPPDGRPQRSNNSNTGNYGSASRRAGRNVKRREIPPVFIPPWFYQRNVVAWDEGGENRSDFKIERSLTSGSEVAESIDTAVEEGKSPGSGKPENEEMGSEEQSHTCMISDVVNGEISSLIHAGLKVPAPGSPDHVASIKPHIVFACPKKGASGILEAIVSNYAKQNEADLLRLAPQDIAEIGGDYLEDPTSFRSSTLSSLGYDTAAAERYAQQPQQASSQGQAEEEDFDEVEEGEEGEEEAAQHQGIPRSFASQAGGMHATAHVVPAFVGTFNLDDLFKSMKKPGDPSSPGVGQLPTGSRGGTVLQVRDDTENMKTYMLIESLLNAPEIKRYSHQQNETALEVRQTANSHRGQSTVPVFHAERGSNRLIVLVDDYPQISMTLKGSKFLEKLHEVVDTRRKEGQSVLIVGTSSSEKTIAPGNLKSSINEVQNQSWNGAARTVLVPIRNLGGGDVMPRANRARISEINARHLRDMLRRIAPVPEQVQNIVSDLDWQFPATLMSSAEENVLSLDEINRIATIALGLARQSESLTFSHITNSISLIKGSDASKHSQLKEQQTVPASADPFIETKSPKPDQQQSDAKMKKLRKTCNSYEKKLLNGVVDPTNIRTTFADIRAPPETIEALQTLTSLSLVRPEAFTYGVLSTDRIPGLLLYGPPGTGKTLLAKAVAKQANATVLEVSGSDVYDMYVGEGEKNVKAIFTLAKKLSPCIVFIDEADAILGARSSGGHGRASHRELINQFLREWDGMSTDMNAFIMVATNRPFDLDEASLRRLPRRLLVDLPVEKDREAILRIHLKDELIDPEVAIPALAANTPFYSGSDLKNLCVAAALSCVQEEFDTANKHNTALSSSSSSSSSSSDSPDAEADGSTEAKDQQYQYPAQRTLHQRHFNKAMEEISASISEDMGSLGAIRKFDEKYGDRKGRRKKLAGGYGFRKVDDAGEKEGSERVRVRNQS